MSKFNPAGSALDYSTYLGGSKDDSGSGIAIDPAGRAQLTGGTSGRTAAESGTANDFPLKDPIQAAPAGGQGDGFVAALSNPLACAAALPLVSVADSTVTEGNTGVTDATFTVSLSAPSTEPVSVNFQTADDTATAPADYEPRTGTLTFAAGETTKTVTVPVKGDTLDEVDERFLLNLSSPQNASISDSQGVGTIVDDDAPPSVSIGDRTVAEGDSGSVDATFAVSLSAPSAKPVSVDFATADDTATAPADYESRSGTLTFAPGDTTRTVTVPVKGDTVDEPDERFLVNISSPQNATVADGQGVGTIADNDGPSAGPALSIGDSTVTEGDAGEREANFTVSLAAPSTQRVSVGFATAEDTALPPGDYTSTSGTLTFDPGETSKTIAVPVKGDTLDEADERFLVNLLNPQNASLSDGQGVGTIVDDDAPPSVSVGDRTVTEGDSGTVDATFAVSLSAPSAKPVSVDFATADDTATAADDYESRTGTVTLAAGETTKTVSVAVKGDVLDEADERFLVNLSNAQNATVADAQGVGTIADNDPSPFLSIYDATVTEGDAGEREATFTIFLSAPSSQQTSVDFLTADDTATAPDDYEPRNGTLTFAAGEVTKTVTVTVKGDTLDEPDERFVLNLTSPTRATVADGQGAGTIADDDAAQPAGSNTDQPRTDVVVLPGGPPPTPGSGPPLKPGACANAQQGTDGPETLNGTPAGDSLLGLGGDDALLGLQAEDCLFGGAGRDRLDGSDGDDRLQGDAGIDVLTGGDGDDRMFGGSGNDRLGGGKGADRLSGGPGNDRIAGAQGAARGKGGNSYSGGSGNDNISAANGRREKVNCGKGRRDKVRADRSDRLRGCEQILRTRKENPRRSR